MIQSELMDDRSIGEGVRSSITSGFILQPLHRDQERLLLIQLALQEGVSLDGLVQTLLEVLQRHDGGSEETRPGRSHHRYNRKSDHAGTKLDRTFDKWPPTVWLAPGRRWTVPALGRICGAAP